ncbi:MAG: GDSL-type esterase/lipase family protein [Nostocaceae cyanobacterium]|nr:GDSL-type esterase/lipase family protein [Nostocaceae cyanobacterium]
MNIINIEAEDYITFEDKTSGNIGGVYRNDDVDIENSNDSNGGYSVGWIETGESLTYNLIIPEDCNYKLVVRAASAVDGDHSFTISIGTQSRELNLENTGGWYAWENVYSPELLSLNAGEHELKIEMLGSHFNLNYFQLIPINNNDKIQEINLDFGNIFNGGIGNQTFEDTGIDTVNYTQTNSGINANLNDGIVNYNSVLVTDTPLTIMPLGDSITEGYLASDYGGYRDDLWSLLTNNGYNIDFVGNRSRGSGNFDKDHAGVTGERIDQVANRVNGLLNTYQPDVVLLMIGTNDILQNNNLDDAPNRLSNLIDQITNLSPNTHLFVASIPPDKNPARNQLVQQYNSFIPSIVNSKWVAGKNVTFVDIFSQMNIYDLEDDVHPTPTGNNKIAQSWYNALPNIYTPHNSLNSNKDTLNNIDNIIGTNYNDTLTGSSTDNIIVGGAGNDVLTGDAGADKFVLASGSGTDIITDFQVGEDLLVLSNNLTYDQINIVSGSNFGYSSNDTLILNQNQHLAVLTGIEANSITPDIFAIS